MTKRSSNLALLACAALGGFLFGYDTAIVNGALFQLQDEFHFDGNSWQNGLVVSIAIAGAFVGSLLAGIIGSRFGRRRVILCADVLFIIGSATLAAAPDLIVVWIGRLILGLGIGLASVIVPVYLAEMSSAQSRGKVVTVNNFFITGAQFIAASLAALFVATTSPTVGWRVMFGLGIVPAALQLIGLLTFLPETARYLASVGKVDEARAVEEAFGLEHVEYEGANETATSTSANGEQTACLQDNLRPQSEAQIFRELFFRKENRKRLIVGMGLQLFQQLSGINTVMYYSSQILRDAGFTGNKSPVYWSVPLAATNAFFTLASATKVDSWGRKKVLVISICGFSVALVLMSVLGFVTTYDPTALSKTASGVLFLILLFWYLMCFAPGMGPVPWIVNSEIYPLQKRTVAAGLATMANWGSNALVSQTFPILMGSIGTGGTFLIIAALAGLSLLFVLKVVPETKGLSLEEMDELFDSH
jgi:SP family myo-inositol transporter-like MFS transporter 13